MSTESNFIRKILRDCTERSDRNLSELIKNPSTVLSIFRCIDQYSQEFIQKIVRLSYHTSLNQVRQETILKRLLDENCPYSYFTEGESDLAQFNLIDFTQKGQNNAFISNYLEIVTNGLPPAIEIFPNNRTVEYREDEGKNKWKQICNTLMMMVSPSFGLQGAQQANKFSNIVMEVFQKILHTGKSKGEGSNLGYQKYMEFILEDTNVQIDKILYQYCITFSQQRNRAVEMVVNFILTLANLDITKRYKFYYISPVKMFEQWEEEIINDLNTLGMVKRIQTKVIDIKNNYDNKKSKEQKIFQITPILWQFCFRKIDLKTLNAKITIETNFNVYAYIDQEDSQSVNSREDQVSGTNHIEKILANFCDLHYKFPHLIVGQLSERKTKEQFRNGLSAKLLIQFFNKTSDPQMKKYLKDKQMNAILLTQVMNIQKKKLEFLNLFKKNEENFSLIPDNIQQEIYTWEREKGFEGSRLDYDSDNDHKNDKE